jgi:hypothetical protein
MLRRWLLLSVPALALGIGCDSAPLTNEYELSGIVSERFESGMMLAPLGGVRITFRSDTGLAYETTTGPDGRYRMRISSDIEFGQVRGELDGFDPVEATVYFDLPTRRVDLSMRRSRMAP